MWKTRFEVSTNNGNGLTRHRTLSSSSSIIHHHYYSGPLPTVPRVREDSPSAVVRPSPPSSMPNLEILTEEDEDIPCLNEQPTSVRKQSSYQIVLPTIIESHDHEVIDDHMPHQNDSRSTKSFVATNTNYNQVIERKERTKNTDMTNFTLDRRINELLQQRKSTNIDKNEILTPTTFKDISAFFENKVLAANTSEQKKIIRAKRTLSLNRHLPDLPKSEIILPTEDQSIVFHHPIKRIKKTHKSEFDSITKPELTLDNNIAEESIKHDEMPLTRTLPKRWFILLLLTFTMLIYFYKYHPFHFFPQQSKEPIHLINNNMISRYGQFARNRFFALLDLLVTFIGQIFFRIDKYEYKNNIVYVATSTYEHFYDWVIHLFK